MRACIHSIETFGTLDGPGIRNVIFFQGCPLRCLYCHNADTRVVKEPNYDLKDLLNFVERYKPFFEASKGGVTASGGEPTMQAEFLGEFFKGCKEKNINTALDTCGYLDIKKAEIFIPFTDIVLLDIKHLDDTMCIKLTGKSNKKALDFLEYLEAKKVTVYLRQVLIPGWTDSYDYIRNLGSFAKKYSCIKRIELLPYHKTGETKWEKLGIESPFNNVPPFSYKKAKEYSQILSNEFNINVVL